MTRRFSVAFLATALLLLGASHSTNAAAPPQILVTDVAHAIEGRALNVTGFVRNLSSRPLSQLVIDVSGFGPSGELVTAGSDGIPWELLPGGSERFSIELPIHKRLVREYVVKVAQSSPPFAPITSLRRGVDVALYQPLILSRIQLRAQVLDGFLLLRADADDLPVTHISAQVTVLLLTSIAICPGVRTIFGGSCSSKVVPSIITDQPQAVTLHFDVAANSSLSVFLGTHRALLLAARVVDFRLRSAWSD